MTSIDSCSSVAVLRLTPEGLAFRKLAELANRVDVDRDCLSAVRQQLVASGKVAQDRVDEIEESFLQFAVIAATSERPVCPSSYEDDYWHQLLLNTRLYSEWCQRNFGGFLHHRPGEQSHETIARTIRLKATYFAVNAPLVATCHGNNCGNSNCGTS